MYGGTILLNLTYKVKSFIAQNTLVSDVLILLTFLILLFTPANHLKKSTTFSENTLSKNDLDMIKMSALAGAMAAAKTWGLSINLTKQEIEDL